MAEPENSPPPPPHADRLCLVCGYNLRGLPRARDLRCPECGTQDSGAGFVYELERSSPRWVILLAHGSLLFLIGATLRIVWLGFLIFNFNTVAVVLEVASIALETSGLWLLTSRSPLPSRYEGAWGQIGLRWASALLLLFEMYRIIGPGFGWLPIFPSHLGEFVTISLAAALYCFRTGFAGYVLTSLIHLMRDDSYAEKVVILSLVLVALTFPSSLAWRFPDIFSICSVCLVPPFAAVYLATLYVLIRVTIKLYQCAHIAKRLT